MVRAWLGGDFCAALGHRCASNPEAIQGPKGLLLKTMGGVRQYREGDDEDALAARMDLALWRETCPSFAKPLREIERLVGQSRQVSSHRPWNVASKGSKAGVSGGITLVTPPGEAMD